MHVSIIIYVFDPNILNRDVSWRALGASALRVTKWGQKKKKYERKGKEKERKKRKRREKKKEKDKAT